MATYASDSNPFLKADLSSNKIGCCTKFGPGTAKPRSSVVTTTDCNNNIGTNNVKESSNINENSPPKDDQLISCDMNHAYDRWDKPDSMSYQQLEEIVKYGDLLVKAAIDLELRNQINLISGSDSDNDTEFGAYSTAPMIQDRKQNQHMELIKKLRLQLWDLERYAYERGELEHVPSSMLSTMGDTSKNTNKPNEELPQESVFKKNSISSPQSSQVVVSGPLRDGAAWSLHIDKVILATDSLVNLFTLEPEFKRAPNEPIDNSLVESIVRRQLVPAIKDLLSYGLIDFSSSARGSSFASLLFDPYYILSSLTCFPSKKTSDTDNDIEKDRAHVWRIVENYYRSKCDYNFKNSSIKTLSQSFKLDQSATGPIKITSRQALLIALDDIIETLSKCKPNGPEAHFRAFIYTALNRSKLPLWLRLIFRNKSVTNNYYHRFSFVAQNDKMDKFSSILEPLNQLDFKLSTDVETIDKFISAF